MSWKIEYLYIPINYTTSARTNVYALSSACSFSIQLKTILVTLDGKEYVWKDNKSNSGVEGTPPLTKRYLISKEYGDVKKSGIEAVIEKGKLNEYRFDLKSRWQ